MSLKNKQILESLIETLQKENLVSIELLYAKKISKDLKESVGIFIQDPPRKIIILKNQNCSYKQVVLNLLHEYGHLLDIIKYGESRRWALFNQYEVSDSELCKYLTYPKSVKRAILKCEYIAEVLARKLLKKYKIDLFTQKELDEELAMTIVVKKSQMCLGKAASGKDLKYLYNRVRTGRVVVNKKYLKDFSYFLEEPK